VGLKNTYQAKATLQSIIDGYKGNDDIVPTAKAKLEKLNATGDTNIGTQTNKQD
jgi:hypothetical protein